MPVDRRPLEAFLRHLVSAVSAAAIYQPDHAQVTMLVEKTRKAFEEAVIGSGEISLLVVGGALIQEGRPMAGSIFAAKLGETLESAGVGSLRFTRGLVTAEILGLVTTLSRKRDRRREIRSTEHVKAGQLAVPSPGSDPSNPSGGRPLRFRDLPEHDWAKILELYDAAKRHGKIPASSVHEIVRSLSDLFLGEADSLLAISTLKIFNEYTFTHSTNVCILNLLQSRGLGIDGQLLHDIGVAGLLHDIGKLFIPEEVLTKPGKLDDEEWRILKSHPVKGAQRLLETPGVPRLSVVVAFEHHMRYNGEGYPSVGNGWVQNMASQLTAVSDFFDALRTSRSYRGALPVDEIREIMGSRSGTDLHPVLLKNFLDTLAPGDKPPDGDPPKKTRM